MEKPRLLAWPAESRSVEVLEPMTNQNLSIALSALARGPPPFSEVEFKPLSGMRAGVKQGRCLLVVAPTFQEVNFDSISPLANSQSVAQPYAI